VTLALAVVAKSDGELSSWLDAHIDHVGREVAEFYPIANPASVLGGYGQLCQAKLDIARSVVFGAVHGDTRFPDGFSAFVASAMSGHVAGMVGSTAKRNVWSRDELRPVRNGKPMSILCLDGCSIFFRRDSGLAFDTITFPGHHCCVEDVCLTARERGMILDVPRAAGEHLGTSATLGKGTTNRAWLGDYAKALRKLRAKHTKVMFTMT
jgi:hypothetical protein